MDRNARIAIAGAGLGGLTLAGLLQQAGFRRVAVYEQTPTFERIGAGIILGASIARVMRRLGVGHEFETVGIKPDAFVSREWDTGATTNELVFDAACEARFGGPFVNIHRADLHEILRKPLAPDTIRYAHRLAGVDEAADGMLTLAFADGQRAAADILVGADGVRSAVRDCLYGPETPRYVGRVGLRAVFPAARALAAGVHMRDCTKWWGPDRHALSYFITARRDEIYIMGAAPEPGWHADSEPRMGTVDEFLAYYEGFHPDFTRLIEVAGAIQVLPIVDRPRRDGWSRGGVVLMGDACHPVRPYMAAGGTMAIEDAAILASALAQHDSPAAAFVSYEAIRVPRCARIQEQTIENSGLRFPHDTEWYFGYDAFAEDVRVAA